MIKYLVNKQKKTENSRQMVYFFNECFMTISEKNFINHRLNRIFASSLDFHFKKQ